MRSFFTLLLALGMLVACGAQQSTPVATRSINTAQQVIDQMKTTGLVINDTLPRTEGDTALDPLYKDHLSFEIIEAGEKRSGMISLCQQKLDCDKLYDGLQLSAKMGLIRVWRSQDGLLVCMIEPTISQPAANQLQTIIENLTVAIATHVAPPNTAFHLTAAAH